MQGEKRDKRSILGGGEKPVCGVIDFIVQTSDIDLSSCKIRLPATYNAGICGGECSSGLVLIQNGYLHSYIINYLINSKGYRHPLTEGSGIKPEFASMCAPLKYRDLAFLVECSGSFSTLYRPNMRIKRCGCVDVTQYTSD